MPSPQPLDAERVKFDESLWPIVVVKMPEGTLIDAELEAVAARISSYYKRKVSFGLVLDVRLQADLPASQRRRIAEYMDRDREQYPTVICATAIVLSNGVQRGVFNVMSWLVKRSAPSRACSTVNEGVSWLREWLRSQMHEKP